MSRAVVFAAILLFACGPSRRAWQPRASSDTLGPSSYAIVPGGTPLSIAPRDGAPLVFAIDQRFAVLRVRGQHDGWAELETIGEEPGHCAPVITRLAPFRLRFYVPERALARLTQREITQSFPDGTAIELARGVPLEPLPGTSLYRAHLNGVATVVQLAPAEVGTRYLPSTGFELPGFAEYYVTRDALVAGVVIVGQTGRVEAYRPVDVPVVGFVRRVSELTAQIRPTCARMTVRLPLHGVAGPGPLLGDQIGESPEPHLLRAGTRLYWRDGSEAGEVARDVRFSRESEPSGDRRCFERVLVFEPQRIAVDLCAARHDTETDASPPSRSLDAPE